MKYYSNSLIIKDFYSIIPIKIFFEFSSEQNLDVEKHVISTPLKWPFCRIYYWKNIYYFFITFSVLVKVRDERFKGTRPSKLSLNTSQVLTRLDNSRCNIAKKKTCIQFGLNFFRLIFYGGYTKWAYLWNVYLPGRKSFLRLR